MLIKILIGFAAAIAVLAVVIAFQPGEFRVTRSALMPVPAAAVFAQVNDFHKWEAWSPWAKRDPAAKNTFAGAAAGTSAVFAWDGNNQVGAGRMTITESRPSESIRLKLEFFRPLAGISTTEFTFKPEGNQTAVTWSMVGETSFIGKAIHLFVNMDKMVGGDFESGLASMKAAAEAAGKP